MLFLIPRQSPLHSGGESTFLRGSVAPRVRLCSQSEALEGLLQPQRVCGRQRCKGTAFIKRRRAWPRLAVPGDALWLALWNCLRRPMGESEATTQSPQGCQPNAPQQQSLHYFARPCRCAAQRAAHRGKKHSGKPDFFLFLVTRRKLFPKRATRKSLATTTGRQAGWH